MNPELAALGGYLRSTREALDYSLEEVEAGTRIRARFIQSFEAGQPDTSLPDPQIRGFLRNYAKFLKLDADEVLAAYEQAQQWQPPKKGWFSLRQRASTPAPPPVLPSPSTATQQIAPVRVQAQPVRRETQPKKPSILPAAEATASDTAPERPRSMLLALIAAFFVLLVGAGVVMVLGQMGGDGSDNEDALNPPLIIDDLSSTANAGSPEAPSLFDVTATPAATETQGGVALPPPMTNVDGLSIFVSANSRSWIEVLVDGNPAYRGLLKPGDAVQYEAQESITFRSSSAGGVEVSLNGQPLGSLGERGALFSETFTRAGIATPTLPPTSTSTTSPTATFTLLAAPSLTATFTSTASATAPESGAALFSGTEAAPLPPPGTALPTLPPANLLLPEAGGVQLEASATPLQLPVPPTLPPDTPTPTMTLTPTASFTPTSGIPPRLTRTPRP